jgi:hypothetical protein
MIADKTTTGNTALLYRSGPLKLQFFLSPSLEERRGKTSNFTRPEQYKARLAQKKVRVRRFTLWCCRLRVLVCVSPINKTGFSSASLTKG